MSVTQQQLNPRPLLGIGSCLAGYAVRYNQQAKNPKQHVRVICEQFDTQPFCPELGIGMGVPRPPIHLMGTPGDMRALDVANHSKDYSSQLAGYATTVLAAQPRLCGYLLVKGSPSCGYDRVKRHSDNGHRVADDQMGIFASALAAADPLLPLEDDERLSDPGLRESFVTRAYAYHDWKQLCSEEMTAHSLIQFYSRYKYLVMAHHIPAYKSLGRLLADAGTREPGALARALIEGLMGALQRPATRRGHTNALNHIAGYLKRDIRNEERQRLQALIERYRQGRVPLAVPVALLKNHFANHPNAYIDKQVFMAPYPDELQRGTTPE